MLGRLGNASLEKLAGKSWLSDRVHQWGRAVSQVTFSSLRAVLLLTVASFALAQPSIAAPLEDGAAAYASGDFNRALQILRPLAEEGNADAQFMLGMMYHNGEGVPRSNLHAYVWFSLSMSNSDATSQDFHDAVQALNMTERAMTGADIEIGREMAYRCQAQHYKDCN